MGVEIAEIELRIREAGAQAVEAALARVDRGMTSAQGKVVALNQAMELLSRGANIVSNVAGGFIRAASEVEGLKVRLVGLMGTEQAAAAEYKRMADLAATTPFSLQGVVSAGVTLRAFGDENKNTLKAVADLAAFMGIDVTEAAAAYGRAFSGGAGAADILRERGVLALIKLRTGIDDLTKLSLPDFRQAMMEAMTDPGGRIAGSTDRLAKTWTGLLSNLEDAWFQAQSQVGRVVTESDAVRAAVSRAQEKILEIADSTSKWVTNNEALIEQRLGDMVEGIAESLPRAATAMATLAENTATMVTHLKPMMDWMLAHPELAMLLFAGSRIPGGPQALAALGAGAATGSLVVSDLKARGHRGLFDFEAGLRDAEERARQASAGFTGFTKPEGFRPESWLQTPLWGPGSIFEDQSERDRKEQEQRLEGYESWVQGNRWWEAFTTSQREGIPFRAAEHYEPRSFVGQEAPEATSSAADTSQLASLASERRARERIEAESRLAFIAKEANVQQEARLGLLEAEHAQKSLIVRNAERQLELAQASKAADGTQVALAEQLSQAKLAELAVQERIIQQKLAASGSEIAAAERTLAFAKEHDADLKKVLAIEQQIALLREKHPAETAKLRAELAAVRQEMDVAKSGAAELADQLSRAAREEAKALAASARTPAEVLRDRVEKINKLHAEQPGIVTDAVRGRALHQAADEFRRTADAGEDMFDRLQDATDGWGRHFTETLASGRGAFKDWGRALLEDFNKMLIDEFVTDPIFGAMKKGLKGISRAGGPSDREIITSATGKDPGTIAAEQTQEITSRWTSAAEKVEGSFGTAATNVSRGFGDVIQALSGGLGLLFMGLFGGGKKQGLGKTLGFAALGGALSYAGRYAGGALAGAVDNYFSSGSLSGGVGGSGAAGYTGITSDGAGYSGVSYHSGGWVRRLHQGAMLERMMLSPDEVPAILQAGEVVVPRHMVPWLRALSMGDYDRAGAHKMAKLLNLPRFHDGGVVNDPRVGALARDPYPRGGDGASAGSRGRSDTGGDTITINSPVTIAMSSLDPKSAAAVIKENMPLIESEITRRIERGGNIARAVGRRR